MDDTILIKGIGVNRGTGSGPVRIILKTEDIKRLNDGDVLVSVMTLPEWVDTIIRVAAIVTDLGGTTSHAAIVSREFGIPAIVGCETATQLLQEGSIVTVDGQTGCVHGHRPDES